MKANMQGIHIELKKFSMQKTTTEEVNIKARHQPRTGNSVWLLSSFAESMDRQDGLGEPK